jgi:hypothetical protein
MCETCLWSFGRTFDFVFYLTQPIYYSPRTSITTPVHPLLTLHPLPLFFPMWRAAWWVCVQARANGRRTLRGLYFGYFDAKVAQPGWKPV